MHRQRADLHMHSTASDGGYSPSELMRKCKDASLSFVSLTDHDTTAGLEEAEKKASELGMRFIPGIELSTKCKGKSVHVLGYGFDYHHPPLQAALLEQQQMRTERLATILKKLKKVGISLSDEDVLKYVDGGSIGRPHVAKALVEHKYVENMKEAFDHYLAEGKPGYVEKAKELKPEEAIRLIHDAHGVAIVAHPVYYDLDEEIISWIINHGLNGIETNHRDHSLHVRKKYDRLVDHIEKTYNKKLIRTGGSDFHHETYGRQIEPLGTTTIPIEWAEQVEIAAKQT